MHTLRDGWLDAAVTALRHDFRAAGYPVPQQVLRVSVGFPSANARGTASQAIGQCFDRVADDGIPQLYISPVLGEPVRILDVLVHEMVHAAVGCEHGHKAPFKRCALALGLTGKMTATVAGTALTARLTTLSADLGPLPHAPIDLSTRRKQSTRLIKAICHEHRYIVRLSRSAIDAHGCPVCPACLYDAARCLGDEQADPDDVSNATLDQARMVEA